MRCSAVERVAVNKAAVAAPRLGGGAAMLALEGAKERAAAGGLEAPPPGHEDYWATVAPPPQRRSWVVGGGDSQPARLSTLKVRGSVSQFRLPLPGEPLCDCERGRSSSLRACPFPLTLV